MIAEPEAEHIAEILLQRLGRDGVAIVRERADACHRHADFDAERFWAAVAQEMLRIGSKEPSLEPSAPPSGQSVTVHWRFMQLIEYCRHLADVAERKGVAAAGPMRGGEVPAAARWREVASCAEQLAEAWTRRRA